MPFPVGETQLKNFILQMVLLSSGSRTPTTRTITAGSAIAVGAATASLTSSAATTLVRAGTALSFAAASTPTDRQQLIIVDEITLGTSAATANTLAAEKAIAANSTATFVSGLIPLMGVQEFALQGQSQTVDTTNTLSGSGTEMASIRQSKTYSVSGIQIIADPCLETIVKAVGLDNALFGREVYVQAIYPDGEVIQGAAKISNLSLPGNQNEVKRYSFELMIMGSSYSRIAPYYFS